ncbi:MAG: hypothetical protein ACYC2R_00160 [Burkholderiales bacterium]
MKSSPSVGIDKYIGQEWQFVPDLDPDTLAIADFVKTYSQSGRWLDLGCGPMLTIWPLFSSSPSHICGLDRNADVLPFHETLLQIPFNELPQDIAGAYSAAYKFRQERQLQQIPSDPRALLGQVKIHDLLEPEPAWFNSFDTVVQIGCFGCLESEIALERAATLAYAYTVEEGVMLSATWLPRDEYFESAAWGGSSLRNLSLDDIVRPIEMAGYMIEHAESAEDININYRMRILVAARRK